MNIILFWASFEKYGFGLLRSSTVWFDAPAQSIGVGQCKIDYDRSPARALIWSLISFYCPLHRLHSAQCAQPSAKLLPSQLLILHKLAQIFSSVELSGELGILHELDGSTLWSHPLWSWAQFGQQCVRAPFSGDIFCPWSHNSAWKDQMICIIFFG